MIRLAATLLTLLAAPAAQAELVTHAVVRYGDGSFTSDEHFGAASASAELLYSGPGLFHGSAQAAAAYGTVSATATVLGVNAAYPVNIAQAEAAFRDTLTISGPAGAGFVIYTYEVGGWSEGEQSLGALFLRHGSDPDEEISDEIGGPGAFASLPHGIIFGQPFSHGVVLQANGGIGLGQTGEFGSELTATMTGLEVFDAAMNPVGQFVVESASGTRYPVPSPAGALLLVLAAAMTGRSRQ